MTVDAQTIVDFGRHQDINQRSTNQEIGSCSRTLPSNPQSIVSCEGIEHELPRLVPDSVFGQRHHREGAHAGSAIRFLQAWHQCALSCDDAATGLY
mmetsp:Transcript_8790/g.15877  ORF Transcript_8790/g.15877 Transcript_8790/m.15877 type:complete len:96 (-) Transcript_8790:1248-1535(-)